MFHPNEILAVFLIRLPEPFPVEDGASFPSYRALLHGESEIFESLATDLVLQRLDRRQTVPYELVRDRHEQDPVPLYNKHLLRGSILFHQTYSESTLQRDLEAPLKLARLLSRPGADVRANPLISEEEKRRVLDGGDDRIALDVSRLRKAGFGVATVAECVVPLRLIGQLPELPHVVQLDHHAWERRDPAQIDGWKDGDLHWTASFDAEQIGSGALLERLYAALDIAISELQAWQRALYASSRRTPMPLVTRQRLPTAVPVLLRCAAPGDDEPAPSQP